MGYRILTTIAPRVKSTIMVVIGLVLLFNTISLSSIVATGQSANNSILLTIPKVTKNGQTELAQSTSPNAWQYDGELTLDDSIRYGWNAVSLDIACKDSPQPACGYLKIYLTNDSSEENLITETGFSPLPLDQISPRLKNGANTIMFVYINSQSPNDRSTKVTFTFNFRNATTRPQISIIEPTQEALFGRGISRDFRIEIANFQLEATDSGLPNRGKLNIYNNAIDPANLLGTISASSEAEAGKNLVTFSSDDINIDQVPDNPNAKLIFALTNTKGELINTNSELLVRTNYQGTLDVGLPKITITEPRKDRSSLNVDTNQKFIVQIDNFEILSEFAPGEVEDGKGYLRILIDDAPVETVWPKNNFSFAEIGVANMTEGRKTIKVELVNKDLSKLVPESFDTIDVVYTPANLQDGQESTTQVQNNLWRIIMVILIVVLVIGGIAVLITKG